MTLSVGSPSRLAVSSTALPNPPATECSSTVITGLTACDRRRNHVFVERLREACINDRDLQMSSFGQTRRPRPALKLHGRPVRQDRRVRPHPAGRGCLPMWNGAASRPSDVGHGHRADSGWRTGRSSFRPIRRACEQLGLVRRRHQHDVLEGPQVSDIKIAVVNGAVAANRRPRGRYRTRPAGPGARPPERPGQRPAEGMSSRCTASGRNPALGHARCNIDRAAFRNPAIQAAFGEQRCRESSRRRCRPAWRRSGRKPVRSSFISNAHNRVRKRRRPALALTLLTDDDGESPSTWSLPGLWNVHTDHQRGPIATAPLLTVCTCRSTG